MADALRPTFVRCILSARRDIRQQRPLGAERRVLALPRKGLTTLNVKAPIRHFRPQFMYSATLYSRISVAL